MKMFTNSDQTAKLIELGFEKPKNRLVKQRFDRSTSSWIVVGEEGNYSIGELIEMLPKHTDDSDILHIQAYDSIGWDVWYGCYCNGDEVRVEYSAENKELIDAIYAMILQLKEVGVTTYNQAL